MTHRISIISSLLASVAFAAATDQGGAAATQSPQNDEEIRTAVTIDPSEDLAKRARAWVGAIPLFMDNGYNARAMCYGIARAMDSQLDFNEKRLMPNLIGKMKSLLQTATASRNGTTAHLNEAAGDSQEYGATIGEQISNLELRLEQQESAMNELRIVREEAIVLHDQFSIDLNLPTYSAVRAGGVQNTDGAKNVVNQSTLDLINKYDTKRAVERISETPTGAKALASVAK